MPKSKLNPLRWLTVPYHTDDQDRSFMERAQTQTRSGIEVTASVQSDVESRIFFGVRMARKGIQPVWIHVVNKTDKSVRLDLFGIDPSYYTPLEAAYVNHFSIGKRLASFGLLSWLFLPLLPLVPFKFFGARSANRRMDQFFKKHGFGAGPVRGNNEKSGFVFTSLDEGIKQIDVKVIGAAIREEFNFSIDVPGLSRGETPDDADRRGQLQETDLDDLRTWIGKQPRSTTNLIGNREGDPLNLVVVGDHARILRSFGARWDETESIGFATSVHTARAFLFDSEYRYSPVSPLYYDGRQQELALQMARANINERIHLRLWRTGLAHEGQQVWIGQISRDIGVRFTLRTWNLTTHKIDPDVDEARDYLLGCLLAVSRVAKLGYCEGVEAASEAKPRRNLTGDPYFSDGTRAVIILSGAKMDPALLGWT
jgi:hypothetical protein